MFTAERVALLLLALAVIVWGCIVLFQKRIPKAALPETTIAIDSIKGTLPSDSVIVSEISDSVSSDSIKNANINTGNSATSVREKKNFHKKKGSGKNGSTKQKKKQRKTEKSLGPRDHLREPIPQE